MRLSVAPLKLTLRRAPYDAPEQRPDTGNRDYGLEDLLDRIEEQQKPTAAQRREAKRFNNMIAEGERRRANRNFDTATLPPSRRPPKKPPRAF